MHWQRFHTPPQPYHLYNHPPSSLTLPSMHFFLPTLSLQRYDKNLFTCLQSTHPHLPQLHASKLIIQALIKEGCICTEVCCSLWQPARVKLTMVAKLKSQQLKQLCPQGFILSQQYKLPNCLSKTCTVTPQKLGEDVAKTKGARIEKSNLLPQQKKTKNTNNTNKSDIFILSLHKQPFNIMFVRPVVIMTKVMIAGTGKWTRCVCVCVQKQEKKNMFHFKVSVVLRPTLP